MTFGERVKKIRLEKGWTQKQLAEKCDMHDSALRRIENGKKTPKVITVEKLSKALEVDPAELMFGDDVYIKTAEKFMEAEQFTIKEIGIRQDTISKYDSLNALGQKKANEYITDLSEQEKYTTPDEEENPR